MEQEPFLGCGDINNRRSPAQHRTADEHGSLESHSQRQRAHDPTGRASSPRRRGQRGPRGPPGTEASLSEARRKRLTWTLWARDKSPEHPLSTGTPACRAPYSHVPGDGGGGQHPAACFRSGSTPGVTQGAQAPSQVDRPEYLPERKRSHDLHGLCGLGRLLQIARGDADKLGPAPASIGHG